MRSLMEWAVVLLGVCAAALVVIAWQFIGADVGAAWSGFWASEFVREAIGRGGRFFLFAFVVLAAGGLWSAIAGRQGR